MHIYTRMYNTLLSSPAWGQWCLGFPNINAATLNGYSSSDYVRVIDVADGTSVNTCLGESGKTCIYRCVANAGNTYGGFADLPDFGVINGSYLTAQGLLIVSNFNGSGVIGTNNMWIKQIFISPHLGVSASRYIDTTASGEWVMDSEYIGNNILINSDFKINQREVINWALTKSNRNLYTVDMWKGMSYQASDSEGSVTIIKNNSGITITNNSNNTACIYQKIEDWTGFVGKQLSLSASIDSIVYKVSAKITNETKQHGISTDFGIVAIYTKQDTHMDAEIYVNSGKTVTINWVKLETGFTATRYVHPSPATEMTKCQRYLQVIKSPIPTVHKYPVIAGGGHGGYWGSSKDVLFYVPLISPMRTGVSPSVSAIGSFYLSSYLDSGTPNVTKVTISGSNASTSVCPIVCTVDSDFNVASADLQTRDPSNSRLIISAEL